MTVGLTRPGAALRETAGHRVAANDAVEHGRRRLRDLQLEVHLRTRDADRRERRAAMSLHIDRAGVRITGCGEGDAERQRAAVDVVGAFPAVGE